MIITSWTNDGCVNIIHKNKRYTYQGVPRPTIKYIETLIKKGCVGKVFLVLKKHSIRDYSVRSTTTNN